jgi:ABC-type molybdate transport system ATPase subunit
VTHDPAEVDRLADRVVLLDNGRVRDSRGSGV